MIKIIMILCNFILADRQYKRYDYKNHSNKNRREQNQ